MGTITVPLKLISLNDDGFHLLAEIVIFKQKHWAVIDTGASRSVFDKSFIEAQTGEAGTGIVEETTEILEETNATTLFTTSSTIQTTLHKLKIGKLTIKNYPAVALDLETVNDAYAQLGHPKIIAIIGSDIFHSYRARINFEKLKLYFSRKPV